MKLKPVRSLIQREAVDEPLKNALWNTLFSLYLNQAAHRIEYSEREIRNLFTAIWTDYFHERIDEISDYSSYLVEKVKRGFILGNWHEMFDLLEFVLNNYYESDSLENETNVVFVSTVNSILEEHLSAYRFVKGMITEITSEEEIGSIEEALTLTNEYKTVNLHLTRALELMSNRENPDYRNSIKESISAIEALSCIITEKPKASLNEALKEIEKKHELHPALKNSFISLYAYTSDSEGIRHKLLEESTLKQEDAKFMLVTCSAFVNYLLAKVGEN